MNTAEIIAESKIIQAIRKDNTRGNTIHFKWDRLSETPADYILDVITHNVSNGQNFLMKSVNAPTHAECLQLMVDYVESKFKDEHNWTVFWTDKDGNTHQSYFRGIDVDEVKTKFFYETSTKSVIDNIKKNSLA